MYGLYGLKHHIEEISGDVTGKNTLYGIDMTEVSECELIYQKY